MTRPKSEGHLLVHADGSPLLVRMVPPCLFVRMVKRTLRAANIDNADYSGDSFCIGAHSHCCCSRGYPSPLHKNAWKMGEQGVSALHQNTTRGADGNFSTPGRLTSEFTLGVHLVLYSPLALTGFVIEYCFVLFVVCIVTFAVYGYG